MDSIFRICQCLSCLSEARQIITDIIACRSCRGKEQEVKAPEVSEQKVKKFQGYFKITPITSCYIKMDPIEKFHH